jgi:hypothetical protein
VTCQIRCEIMTNRVLEPRLLSPLYGDRGCDVCSIWMDNFASKAKEPRVLTELPAASILESVESGCSICRVFITLCPFISSQTEPIVFSQVREGETDRRCGFEVSIKQRQVRTKYSSWPSKKIFCTAGKVLWRYLIRNPRSLMRWCRVTLPLGYFPTPIRPRHKLQARTSRELERSFKVDPSMCPRSWMWKHRHGPASSNKTH